MKEILNKNKISISILTFTILVALFHLFVVENLYFDTNEKKERIQERIADKEIIEEKIKSLPEIRGKISSIKEEEGKIQRLISKSQIVDLIKDLEGLAEKTGNKISFSVIEEDKNKKKDEKKKDHEIKLPSENYLKIKISLEGNETNIFNFIKKIENIHYWNDIISIQIKAFEKEVEADSLSENNPEKVKNKYQGITADLETLFYTEN